MNTDAAEHVGQTTETPSSPETSHNFKADSAPQVTELDKLERFKYQGQEWTPKDLEKAILRHKDYTQKTQSLSEERKSFDSERKFYENLHVDLENVRANPQLASKFLEVYPEQFHSFLKQLLSSNQRQQSQTQNQNAQNQNAQTPDIELLSRLNKLERFYNDQEVSKNTVEINAKIDKLSKQFPDALPKAAIADIFELVNRGTKITAESWERAFRESDEEMKSLLKTRYGNLQKQQTQANAKSRDVETGGGTPGRAPQKFKSLKEVTEFAANDLKGRS